MQTLWTARGADLTLEVAATFLARLRGLMLRAPLPPAHGLLLAPCASIHMCFMRFAIDAVYIDHDYRVLKVAAHLRPWLGLSACPGAWGCIELTSGEAARLGIAAGERLRAEAAVDAGDISRKRGESYAGEK